MKIEKIKYWKNKGSSQNKKSKSGGGGGGSAPKNWKFHNSKCRLFWDEGGGSQIFRVFPNSNGWNMALILMLYVLDICKI